MKKETNASGLLTMLAEKLLKYANGAELKSETKKARGLLVSTARSFNNQSGHMAAIQNLDGKISSHAMEIIKAQQAQAMAYNVQLGMTLPNGVQTYILHRFVVDPQASELLAADDEKRLREDYALPCPRTSVVRLRHTTLGGCSCQFPTCWGLPCRHMLRLCLHLQVLQVPRHVINPRWITHDAAHIAQQKRILLRTTTLQMPTGGSRDNQQMTRAERYNYLLSEFKSLSEVASTTEEAMNIVMNHMDLARAKIAELQLPSTDGQGATHSFNTDLFPTNVMNPGLPSAIGRPQRKRIESSGKFANSKRKKTKP